MVRSGWSNAEAARRLERTEADISRYRKGKAAPHRSFIRLFGMILDQIDGRGSAPIPRTPGEYHISPGTKPEAMDEEAREYARKLSALPEHQRSLVGGMIDELSSHKLPATKGKPLQGGLSSKQVWHGEIAPASAAAEARSAPQLSSPSHATGAPSSRTAGSSYRKRRRAPGAAPESSAPPAAPGQAPK